MNELVEIGSGYGTFTLAAARRISGTVYAIDIEQAMIAHLQEQLQQSALPNVQPLHHDVLSQGSGLAAASVDYVMLFNILHHEAPHEFLNEAHRILRPGGKVGILHWRSDVPTPRGPDLSIRPRPEQVLAMVDSAKYAVALPPVVLPPYHYGLVLAKLV